ncbi:MAG TPA: hypothetical protein VEI96_01080 [Thermodesulfovibrionales bacterium]|nr:hypothetical protein [Thermodesulfovibrionales bacterium]
MVRELMIEFADRTGLLSDKKPPRRYLWTDAFAVCNFLELYHDTGDEHYRRLALSLVDQVHAILGRHREDDTRNGWISGLGEQEGRLHPTIGGLRIGKQMNERRPSDPFDEDLERDRDGQYYHYLTKWMHALNRVSRITGDATYLTWAMELAKTVHARFTYVPLSQRQRRMYWKMSIDPSYPLVPSMGHHDPLDGYITYNELQASAGEIAGGSTLPDLSGEIADMAAICRGKSWATDDPLGIGDALCIACKVVQLFAKGHFEETDLFENLLDSSLVGLESYAGRHFLQLPIEYRLAFRELGLSIGLRAVEKMRGLMRKRPDLFDRERRIDSRVETLMRHAPITETIETLWLQGPSREARSWTAHRDINTVMLATSLAPDEYLTL